MTQCDNSLTVCSAIWMSRGSVSATCDGNGVLGILHVEGELGHPHDGPLLHHDGVFGQRRVLLVPSKRHHASPLVAVFEQLTLAF